MPPPRNASAPPSTSPWQVVPLDAYALPGDSQPAALRRRWRALARLLRGDGSDSGDSVQARAEAELRSLPRVRLENLAPPLDWSGAAEALSRRLAEDAIPIAQAPADGRPQVRVLVCPPPCDHGQILTHWATAHGARVLEPPAADALLGGAPRWLEHLAHPLAHPLAGPIAAPFAHAAAPDTGPRPWVLPRLERCFLRHADGLALLRDFLDAAFSGRLGSGLIGCDSWAFAFVQRIWPLPAGSALTLQAFDGEALAEHFVRPHGGEGGIEFRSARSGKPLLPAATQSGEAAAGHGAPSARGAAEEVAEDDTCQVAPELRQLAAHARGNPGLAWHYWRRRLCAAPEAQHAEAAAAGARDAQARAGRERILGEEVVWLADEPEPPALPAGSGEDDAFIFHALLVHGGLHAHWLPQLLPIPAPRLRARLLRLEALGLVAREDAPAGNHASGEAAQPPEGRWRVAPLAYLTVREFLRGRSYLTDAF